MAKYTGYRCDVCSNVKQEANHWWDVWVEDGTPSYVCVGTMDPEAEDAHKIACGEKCVMMLISRYLSSRTLG